MRFGVHTSISGGLVRSVERAAALGCDCLQLFACNPRSWSRPRLRPADAEGFRLAVRRAGLRPVVVHVTYLPNLASPEAALYEKSVRHVEAQYAAAAALGAEFFVIHPGSHKGSGLEAGAARIAAGLNLIFEAVPEGPQLLLENTAGGGDTVGRNPGELAAIAAGVEQAERLGLCLDTCHAWSTGVDLRRKTGFRRFLTAHTGLLGAGVLKLLHLNDSQAPLGHTRDRHYHVGLGTIGEEGIGHVLHTAGVRRLPVILETPIDETRGDAENLAAARRLAE
jgi:deoxyribonuclease-4